ncbi:MAG: hypothetical protein MHM6MM_008099 [Cercozoa sp. M6MM]
MSDQQFMFDEDDEQQKKNDKDDLMVNLNSRSSSSDSHAKDKSCNRDATTHRSRWQNHRPRESLTNQDDSLDKWVPMSLPMQISSPLWNQRQELQQQQADMKSDKDSDEFVPPHTLVMRRLAHPSHVPHSVSLRSE